MWKDRPTFDELPYTRFERGTNVVTALLNAAGVAALAFGWSAIPARIPTHFDLAGTADAWGSKSTLIILPLVLAVMNVMLSFLQKMPESYNYPVPVTPATARSLYLAARRFMILFQLALNVVLWSLAGLIALVGAGVFRGLPAWWLLLSLGGLAALVLWGVFGLKRGSVATPGARSASAAAAGL